MLGKLVTILATDEDELIRQFKALHQLHGTSERPFTAVELPAAQAMFQGLDRLAIARELEPAFQTFEQSRDATLRSYQGVDTTLSYLHSAGVAIVGHTEAPYPNACQRLRLLGIDRYFDSLYATASDNWRPDRGRPHSRIPDEERLVHILPVGQRKPNPEILLDICDREGVQPAETVYVGDSLTRDISMANAAGVISVWASYGTSFDPQLWAFLVRISHWTDREVAREAELRRRDDLAPNFEITSFGEIVGVAGLQTPAHPQVGTVHELANDPATGGGR
jgi:phosphoglycolate phosphatase